MKYLKTLQSKINNKITMTAAISIAFIMVHSAYAQDTGLKKAETALNSLKTGISGIISIAATIILLCLAIGYAGRFIEKNTFIRWAIGVVIAGSAGEIVTILTK